ncbi:3-isopropylmalate dehydratase large subunit [Temperatibacter marinus]|uniref:3-isopropylmalate dehydratase n=1 Tax=Temperatibacter marinus TaxID=1456591 RepID=A0AA52HBD3_9PROT|nr:3-isopropylmalate dehydratase large subunit [Temperatibacter marinus]WND03518.1 3-isopropylmalate dehydratase large subunit [Temperatibacter marinus]
MSHTLFDKIWDQHCIAPLKDGSDLIYIDRLLLHERTGSVALKAVEEDGRSIANPAHVFCVMDHILDTYEDRSDQTTMPSGTDFIQSHRMSAVKYNLPLFDVNDETQGIVHVISPEQAIVLPGLTVVCPDSHTCTQGAFGALAWGIGSTQAEHALVTETLSLTKPNSMRITLEGSPQDGVTAKDIVLALIGSLSAGGAVGYVVEFAGPVVEEMDMEARMTLCNMAVEFSAFTALIAPDQKTFDYLKAGPYAPKGKEWKEACKNWLALKSEENAVFDQEITFDVSALLPSITWGTSPEHMIALSSPVPSATDSSTQRALDYMGLNEGDLLTEYSIDAAFIGSCTNSRISDLRRAATIIKGRKVADGVTAIVVPGSMKVRAQAEKEGIDKIFKEAGFEWRKPGCSMCFYAGGEHFGFQERVITTTNRNFESRQGPKTRSHLASPETVAASALMGKIIAASMLEDL